MKSKGLSTVILTMVAMICVASVASAAIPNPVWPWGTNPKTNAPVNGFCDAQQAILDNSLLSMLPPEFTGLLSYLAPGTGDINGTSFVVIDPLTFSLGHNGMLDCSIELKLIEEVLRNTAFSVNGLTYSTVLTAMQANDTQFALDVGTYWGLLGSLANGLPQVLLGHMTLGDGDATLSDYQGTPPKPNRVDATGSAGFIKAVMALLGSVGINNPYIDVTKYSRLPQYFGKFGDADGDGATNECEYRIYGSAAYAANALNPAVTPLPTDCAALPVFGFASVSGAGWYEVGLPSITLAVAVTGETGTVTYAWSKDGSPIGGATNNSYVLNSPTEAASGVYTCVATDQSKATITATLPVSIFAAGSLPVTSLAGLAAMLVVLGAMAVVMRRRVKA